VDDSRRVYVVVSKQQSMRPEMLGGSYLRLDFPYVLCLYSLTITMCWDEYNNHKAALAAERVLRNYILIG
jgi:hypothetical protein